MQQRRPKIALPDKITFNDPFHLIIGSNHVEVPMKIRTHRPGIDIIYNKQQCLISVRYTKYIYNDSFINNSHNNSSISESMFVKDMMSGITIVDTNSNEDKKRLEGNCIQLNSYIQRENDEVLKVSRFNETNDKVILTYIYPLEKRGTELIEDNLVKLSSEINQLIQINFKTI
jgi:hypothetical protein